MANNWCENFGVVDAMTLRKTAGDPSCFVAVNFAVSVFLYFENPFSCDYVAG